MVDNSWEKVVRFKNGLAALFVVVPVPGTGFAETSMGTGSS
jgi:hypothetical protein